MSIVWSCLQHKPLIVASFTIRFDDDRRPTVTLRPDVTSPFSVAFPSVDAMGRSRASVALLAAAVAVAQLVSVTDGHVALTFPAARRFDLDFLDNLRTRAPCGMPKGKDRNRKTAKV